MNLEERAARDSEDARMAEDRMNDIMQLCEG
jgi:hypothetical protein